MKKHWTLNLLLTFIILILSGCSGFNVIHITEDAVATKTDGVFYSLPRTFVSIEVVITETEKIKGPYAAYASKYLGLKNVRLSNSKTFEISDININTYSEPDPNEFYYVELGNKYLKKNKEIMLHLSESGLIQNINEKSELATEETLSVTKSEEEIDYSKTFKYFADDNLMEQIDTVIELVNLDTITIEKTVLKKTIVEKSMELKAKEAADFIMQIKENRFKIITGYQEVPYDKGTIEYMYTEMEELENEYMMLFTGMTITRTHKYRYTYLPESNVYSASTPLFKFSKKNGVMKPNDAFGEMVYIHINRSQNTKKVEAFLEKNNNPNKKSHGFYYRIPDYAKFTIKQGITSKAEASFLVSQFGIVTFLPAKQTKLKFYPNTGGIKSVGVE
ncbi:MAG: DUF4831 family protein [Saprospiraceae bacterium]|nr:DUF4831 family protein [Saprospiraceae bacterium]